MDVGIMEFYCCLYLFFMSYLMSICYIWNAKYIILKTKKPELMRRSLSQSTLFVSEWTVMNLKNICWSHIMHKILAEAERPQFIQQSSWIIHIHFGVKDNGSQTFVGQTFCSCRPWWCPESKVLCLGSLC